MKDENQHGQTIPVDESSGYHFTAAFLILGLTALIYSNTLNSPFVLDDLPAIQANPHLQLLSLDYENLYEAAFRGPFASRPLGNLTLALNHYVHRQWLPGYHLVNLLIHFFNGLLVYLLALILLRVSRLSTDDTVSVASARLPGAFERRELVLAMMAALIFSIHPLQTQSVNYILQRMGGLATLFYLTAFLGYLYGRTSLGMKRWCWWVVAMAAWIGSLGCKEDAVMLPVTIACCEWAFMPGVRRGRFAFLSVAAIVLLAVALAGLVSLGLPNPMQGIAGGDGSMDLTTRLLTQARGVVFYFSLFFLPLSGRFNVMHWLAPPQGNLLIVSVFAGLLLCGILLWSVVFIKRYRLMAFGILWLLLNLVVNSGLCSDDQIWEHRMYLPMAGFALLVVGLLDSLQFRLKTVYVVGWLLVIQLGVLGYQRNHAWASQMSLWYDAAGKNVQVPTTVYNRGHAYQRAGDTLDRYIGADVEGIDVTEPVDDQDYQELRETLYNRAVTDYYETLKRDPGNLRAYNNLGNLLAQRRNYQEALELFDQAIEKTPDSPLSYNNRGNLHVMRRNFEAAREDYNRALEKNENYALAYFNRARLAATQEDDDGAMEDYSRAVQIDPRMFQAYLNRGNLHFRKGNYRRAMFDFDRAVKLRPNSPFSLYHRAVCYKQMAAFGTAIDDLIEAIRLRPRYAEAYNLLGWIRGTCYDRQFRNGDRAVTAAEFACKITERNDYRYLETLAAAYAEAGDFEKAEQTQQEVIELGPSDELSKMTERLRMYQRKMTYREKG